MSQATPNSAGVKTRLAGDCVGSFATITAEQTITIARPTRDSTFRLRLPSSTAAPIPHRKAPGWVVTSWLSRKLRAAQPTQRKAGARNGRRRRAHSARTTTLNATTSNHSWRPSGWSASVRSTVPIALATTAPTIRRSSPQTANHRQTRPIGSRYGRRPPAASYESRTPARSVATASFTSVPDDARPAHGLAHPARWALGRVEHAGWFTTGVTFHRGDGTSLHWASRAARRRGWTELRDAEGRVARIIEARPTTARRLARVNVVAAVSFIIGGSMFAIGPLLAEFSVGSIRTADVVYLVGGVFFSLGGYASVLQASNMPTDVDESGSLSSAAWSWWRWRWHQIGWLSVLVLFVGTLFFGVSLVAAFAENLTARQSNGWIWLPDILGCVCFLASGHLALLEVCHGRIGVRTDDLGWWIVAVNQVGSVLFFLAGLAAFVWPATSTVVNEGIVNWGTFGGAVCFVAGGVLQLFERPAAAPAPAVVPDPA